VGWVRNKQRVFLRDVFYAETRMRISSFDADETEGAPTPLDSDWLLEVAGR